MILRNGKIIKYNFIRFSDNIQIKYYILSFYEKLQKKNIIILLKYLIKNNKKFFFFCS